MRGTALAEGRGEILTRLPACPEAWIVLAKPAVGMSTAAVYKAIDAIDGYSHPDTEGMIDAIKKSDINAVASKLSNVLENASIPMCPMIGDIKKMLSDMGAVGVLMSGSGPTAYGIFKDKETAQKAADNVKKTFNIRDVYTTKIFNI